MRVLPWAYQGREGGCGPATLAQITDASDQAILSACCLHGFDPATGGMESGGFRAAAQSLGVKFGPWLRPKPGNRLGDLVRYSALKRKTFVVGVPGHVLVVRNGDQIDVGGTPGHAPVTLALEVLAEGRAQ